MSPALVCEVPVHLPSGNSKPTGAFKDSFHITQVVRDRFVSIEFAHVCTLANPGLQPWVPIA